MQLGNALDANNNAINNLPDATLAQQPATFKQLQAAIEGLAWKDDVIVATQANINLAAPGAAIDGITLAANDRVLVKAQTAGAENGVYLFNGSATPMTRALDMNTSTEFNMAMVPVQQGTSFGTKWRCTTLNPTVGTTSVVFAADSASAPSASETTSGIAEIATQAETDAGTDDLRFVTPMKLKSTTIFMKRYSTDIGDGSATSYAVTHNLGTLDVQVQVYKNTGNKDLVIADVQRTSTNVVTIVFGAAPASGAYRVVVMG